MKLTVEYNGEGKDFTVKIETNSLDRQIWIKTFDDPALAHLTERGRTTKANKAMSAHISQIFELSGIWKWATVQGWPIRYKTVTRGKRDDGVIGIGSFIGFHFPDPDPKVAANRLSMASLALHGQEYEFVGLVPLEEFTG